MVKGGLRGLDRLHLLALGLLATPMVAVFALGVLWLWQAEQRFVWLAGLGIAALAGFGLQLLLKRCRRPLLADSDTAPDPDWPPSAEAAWADVEAMVDDLDPEAWPLTEPDSAIRLGRRTLETVARRYHPEVSQPLLELTLPHTLMIVERAARDLRADIVDHVPFSHRLTVGDLTRAQRWKDSAERVFDVYRAGRVVINPLDALIGEVKRHLVGRSFGLAREELQRWLLRAYVRRVGRYAIELYSGRLPLDEDAPAEALTRDSRADLSQAEAQGAAATSEEPLRIAVMGRTNAGKSSLINALFGRLTAATDVLHTTRDVTAHVLERDGFTRALVLDTPGLDSAGFDREAVLKTLASVDLLLWVSAVNRPDRSDERATLDAVRAWQASRADRRPAPLVVVASHIDQLRPAASWSPPYDLAHGDDPKARNIRAAVEALAGDLAVDVSAVVPVCLAEGRDYNVSDTLWAAMLAAEDGARRARLLRCLEARRREQDWSLLWRQLKSTGRLLKRLPVGR